MFDMRLLWFGWSVASLGVAGTLGSYRMEASPVMVQAAMTPLDPAEVPTVAEGGGRVVIPRGPDGLFYVTGAIRGRKVRFLIDTGSSLVVLTPDDAVRAGLGGQANQSTVSVRTAGGVVEMATSRVRRIDIAGRALGDVKAVISDGASVSLLGQSALAQLGQITLARDQITIESAAS
jgi:clan AA aspartic protease (TIGR02281 family)